MEVAYDAHVIWLRAAPQMRLTIGDLMNGKSQVEVESELRQTGSASHA
jgi:hypothetical protein